MYVSMWQRARAQIKYYHRSAEGQHKFTTLRYSLYIKCKMGYITYVFCLPVRALLYVLLKPPLLVYALIKYCVLSIVR